MHSYNTNLKTEKFLGMIIRPFQAGPARKTEKHPKESATRTPLKDLTGVSVSFTFFLLLFYNINFFSLYANYQGINYYTSLKALVISCGLNYKNRRCRFQATIVCFVELAEGLHVK